jgi:hypothetical protein
VAPPYNKLSAPYDVPICATRMSVAPGGTAINCAQYDAVSCL